MANIREQSLYEYQPIDLDKPGIRLIRLFRGKFADDVVCELFEGYVDQEIGIPYDALSYTWGSNETDRAITVDKKTMYVTSNLFQALYYLRFEHQDRIMWIDALCIDQNNEREKGHQVNQMGRIYKEAEQVVIWLGQSTPESDLVMDFLNSIVDGKEQAEWRNLAQARLQHRKSAALDQGMASLLKNPWFRRVWIIQEVANARLATVVCGLKSISSRIFALVPSYMGLVIEPHCQAILDIMPGFSRKESWWAESRDLHTLLWKFRESEATDKRDIVYALLGISSDSHGSDVLTPDYTKSLSEVLRTTIWFLQQDGQNLDNGPPNLEAGFYSWTVEDFFREFRAIDNRALGQASQMGNVEEVKVRLATRGTKVNSLVDKQTALIRASQYGHLDVVQILLEHGASMKTINDCGSSPLIEAVQGGYRGMVEFLLEHGADIEAAGSPLTAAAERGHTSKVQALPKYGANIKATDASYSTPLGVAAANGQTDIIRVLLENGAEIEAMDSENKTALQRAALVRETNTVLVLLQSGAKIALPLLPDLQSFEKQDYYTLLTWASECGYMEVERVLLQLINQEQSSDLFWLWSWTSEVIGTYSGLDKTVNNILEKYGFPLSRRRTEERPSKNAQEVRWWKRGLNLVTRTLL